MSDSNPDEIRQLCGPIRPQARGGRERLWQTVKDEELYLRAYASLSEARASIRRYLAFYNGGPPHSSLGGQTPDQAYLAALQPIPAAA